MNKALVEVAIGLLFYQGQVLVGWREAKQHQGNKYEFPGGKVELNETAQHACRRETREEVGIDIAHWHAFDLIKHEYEDLCVHLHIFHAEVNQQQLGQIQSPWTWQAREQLLHLSFPKANQTIIQRLCPPQQMKILNVNLEDDLVSVQQALTSSIDQGWIYLRGQLSANLIAQLETCEVLWLQRLVVNIEVYQQASLALQTQIAAVHFRQQQMTIEMRPQHKCCLAACHDQASLILAQELGFEVLLLSPVHMTASHPEQVGLGWQAFEQLAQSCAVPVFALGGIKPTDLAQAQQHAAYGVAGLSGF